MFRVVDDRPGSQAEVSVAGLGPLRVYAHVRAAADLTGLRVLLVTDLLARAGELGGLQVLTTRAFTGERAVVPAVEDAATALGIRPPVLPDADLDFAGAWPGGPAVVHVVDDDAIGDDNRSGILIHAAAARLAQDAAARPGGTAAGMLGGHDPLAVRLALISLPRRQPAELTAGQLADAAQTLSEWRRRVARWAEAPSGAIPKPVAETFRAAFGSLDIAAVLALLRSLAADETVPAGPRFETFLYADRVLGLDLPRDIGR